MSYKTLISTGELANHLNDDTWVIVDCRFSLDQPERGRQEYMQAHIPGAVYAHLNKELSGPIIPGKTGRHPLPSPEVMAETFSNWGISDNVQVVAYDDSGGSMAARLWWLLRWLGHNNAAVLDGGWNRWRSEGLPIGNREEYRKPQIFSPRLRSELVVDAAEVLAHLNDPAVRIIDARAAERYRGEVEPIDPVAGHIPGATSVPFTENLGADGRFLPPEQLGIHFQALLGNVPPEQTIFYCGSGVTAAHNVLALVRAGLGDARLYAGSWSDWITDPGRPIEKG